MVHGDGRGERGFSECPEQERNKERGELTVKDLLQKRRGRHLRKSYKERGMSEVRRSPVSRES